MKKMCKKSYLFISFGLGCVIMCCLPAVWVTRVLAIVIITLGFVCCRK